MGWRSTSGIVGYWQKLPTSKRPSSKSYLAVREGVVDELFVAKLSSDTSQARWSQVSPNIKQTTQYCRFLGQIWRDCTGHFCNWLPNLMSLKNVSLLLLCYKLISRIKISKIERYPFWILNDKIRYLQLMSELLKKKLLLRSFLLSKRCQKKALWIIVWSELQMFLMQFWWFPWHYFIFEEKWKSCWLTSFHWRLFLSI